MSDLPTPLTPPECDLTDFQYMELDVRRLRDSKFAASPDAEAFRAGVLLWCAAWHQVPAGSLPDDDVELANLAGYGRVVKEWRKVRDGALTGFIKCSDGRLYHSVIAEKALSAFKAKLIHQYERFQDRIRKHNAKAAKEGKAALGIPTFEQWKSGQHQEGIPQESNKDSGGNPQENALKGNGEGTERERNGTLNTSVTTVTGGVPPGLTSQEALFQIGIPSIVEFSATPNEKGLRSILGSASKQLGPDAAWLLAQECIREKPIEPIAWIAGALNHRLEIKKSGGKKSLTQQQDDVNAEAKRMLGLSNTKETIDG